MAAIFSFKCSCCGKIHEGSPSFGFREPNQYSSLSTEQKVQLGTLTDDFCTISDEDGTDYFIRTVLEVPIYGIQQPFLWGVWVSLSQKSFERYRETYNSPVEGETFFGWVCNSISLYPNSSARPADVVVQSGGKRPKVILHDVDHQDPLLIDQKNGISIARAQELAERAIHDA